MKELYAQQIVKRADLFITTKVARDMREPKKVRDSIDQSLKELDVDYIEYVQHNYITTTAVFIFYMSTAVSIHTT